MLDPWVRRRIDPSLGALAAALARAGLGADALTLAGFAAGIAAAVAVALSAPGWAVVGFALNRLLDGLDGAVARARGPTDRGAFLDISLDFVVYAALPVAFAIADPPINALPAAILLFTFVATATSFLAYAIFAEKNGIASDLRGRKSLYYLGGLTEGTETSAVLLLMCLVPAWFPWLAYAFAAACAITAVSRVWAGAVTFARRPGSR